MTTNSKAKATFIDRHGDEQTVRVGDYVGFKADIEQYAAIISITPRGYGRFDLKVYNQNGLEGYHAGSDTAVVCSSDIWVE